MRLNYSTYPIWKEIESSLISSIDSPLLEVIKKEEEKAWRGAFCIAAHESIKGNLNFLTKPFRNAVIKAIPKIISSTKEYLEKPIYPSILLHEGGGTIIYNDKQVDCLKIMLVGFDRNKIVAWGTMNTTDYAVGGQGDETFLKNYNIHNYNDLHGKMSDWFTYILTTNYFINNCDIEIKQLKPKEKYRTYGEKHLNESKKNLRILDCTWFTTLISNIKQNVSGHLRWQPCGKERLQRKLIWINSFERKGFIRKAKVLNENGITKIKNHE